ncbi:AraC family transcriptional regulator [Dokdonia sinensis]|uniref:AraC family transcriptional regulator n=1 Tax=Dokdonia sinensis TaxID=2479847 RepID=A0A3M0G8G8_9FLAO|nr:AraC family transcriptional regulator [Dokdonia sinensis]RMB60447.1 AraC family transcriptional regulator [Dokdonia sinensis]
MKRFNLQDVFLINQVTRSESIPEMEGRNYFEIIFIEKGKGKHFINEFIVHYEKGDIFLVAPEDKHHFIIEEETIFCYFQFTELLFSSKMNLPDRSYWMQRIEHIINHPNLMPGDVMHSSYDRNLIWHIHEVIIAEYNAAKEFHKHNISNMVSTILSIIARNIAREFTPSVKKSEDKHATIDQILSHIRKHTYDTNLMKISAIANKFHMTNSALSAYFKKHTGDSLHHYILMYKLHMVKYRLKNTDFTVSEIAYQMGFTDESHLTRIFKKYNQVTPKKYKLQDLTEQETKDLNKKR